MTEANDYLDVLYRSNWRDKQGRSDALNLAELITESIHQNFDGWSDEQKQTIKAYLLDLQVGLSHL